MKRIERARGTGKTKELIEYALENDCTILAFTAQKAASLREKSIAYFGKPVRVSYGDEPDLQGKVLIDDLDGFLPCIIRHLYPDATLEGWALTTPEDYVEVIK